MQDSGSPTHYSEELARELKKVHHATETTFCLVPGPEVLSDSLRKEVRVSRRCIPDLRVQGTQGDASERLLGDQVILRLSHSFGFFFLWFFVFWGVLFILINFFFFNFCLRWVFVAAHRLSLVAASGRYCSLWCAGFSLWWLLLLQRTDSSRMGFSSFGSQALERKLSSCDTRA